MNYVDGFVLAVPTANRDEYRETARATAEIYKDHGALNVMECWGDDVPNGKVTSFPIAVNCKADETVVFCWVVWPSKEARDAGNKKVMADPHMQKWTTPPSMARA